MQQASNDYTCYLISNKPHLFSPIQESIAPIEINFFNGDRFDSFSKLVNSCAAQSPTEIVIMMSDKVMPKEKDVKKLLSLLEKGYGFVALYRFAFFGFKKELFRKIGPMDEGFIGGGYEDDDFYLRLKEANIAMYVTEEVPYEKRPSSWSYSLSAYHFINKWIPNYDPNIKMHHNEIKRRIPEPVLTYNWGDSIPTNFLDWGQTFAIPSKARKYVKI